MPSHVGNVTYLEHKSSEIAAAIESRVGLSQKLNHDSYSQLDANVKLHLITANKNGGFGAGNNLALQLIQLKGDAECVWLLNNDTVVTPDAMTKMVDCAKNNNGIVGATLHYYHSPKKIQAYGGGYFSSATGLIRTETHARPNHLDFINGASFMFSSRILKSVGYFDENIFLYFEEFDYCFRAKRNGFGCYLSDAIVYHKHGASSSNTDDSFAWRHVLKNKPYVLKKNFGYGFWVIIYIFGVMASALGLASASGKRKASRAVISELLGQSFTRLENSFKKKNEHS
jgi:GT2 family glycosyltransferase